MRTTTLGAPPPEAIRARGVFLGSGKFGPWNDHLANEYLWS